MTCIGAPPGVQPPPGLPTEEGVELITKTILSFEGGMTTFDTTDNKAKFEAAVVVAMAASPDGLLGVQCKVSAVTATGSGRRLARSLEVQVEVAVATSNRHELVDVSASSKVQLVVEDAQDAAAHLKGAVRHKELLAALFGNDAAATIASLTTASATLNELLTASTTTRHRALAAEQITITYAVTVPVADNAALGGPSAVRAATVATYDAVASGTGGAGVPNLAAALAAPSALDSDMDQSTISSLDSSSADFFQAVKQVPSGKEPIYFIALDPGMWRGAGDRIDGLRECKNTAGTWLDACVGGGVFGEYCAQGHTGPLCAVCETNHFKDDPDMCKTCPSSSMPTKTSTAPIFIRVRPARARGHWLASGRNL